MKRLTRAEQSGRNRALVLDAARSVFLARGYHAATVEEIADKAGFSRGVVYSRFGTKADLLLALLDRRIDELAEQNAALARDLSGDRGAVALMDQVAGRVHDDPGWGLLLIEFRLHAARDPGLNRRYAAAHRRTTAGLAAVLADVYERAGQDPPFPAGRLAGLQARTQAELTPRLMAQLQRLNWDADRLAGHQTDRLRALLARAIEGSPFHARRLGHIDPARFELADLPRLPTMTNAEMMASTPT